MIDTELNSNMIIINNELEYLSFIRDSFSQKHDNPYYIKVNCEWISNPLNIHDLLLLCIRGDIRHVLFYCFADDFYYTLKAYLYNYCYIRKDKELGWVLELEPKEDGKLWKTNIRKSDKITRLFPAMFVSNIDELRFFQSPISRDAWDLVFGDDEINEKIFLEKGEELKTERKFWYVFYALRNYVKYQDKNKMSAEGGRLRERLLKENYKLFKDISLLAVLLFAQYDFYYRLMLEKSYKERHNKRVQFAESDFILEEQGEQDRDKFLTYMEECKVGRDIKTFAEIDATNKKVIHSDVLAEISEAMFIAEGLLQILENAVQHASGGLLSIYIREKDSILDEYCNVSSLSSDDMFFLEVDISDISDNPIPYKFAERVESRARVEDELKYFAPKLKVDNGKVYFNDLQIRLKSFFDPDPHETEMWDEFYGISINRIHHYGMQIFDSIVTSRNGLLVVSGFNDFYCNDDKFETKVRECPDVFDVNAHGTSYRVLLPLAHKRINDGNIAMSMFGVDESVYRCKVDFISALTKGSQTEIQTDLRKRRQSKNLKSCEAKDDAIEIIKSKLKQVFDRQEESNFIIDYSLIRGSIITPEIFFKALLWAAFDKRPDKQIKLAIVNINSFKMLEAVRLISLFYNKVGKNIAMENVQIYLRSSGNNVGDAQRQSIGEEIVFYGEDLNNICGNYKKTALMRGTANKYIGIIERILKRSRGR